MSIRGKPFSCTTCDRWARLTVGAEIYPHRPDLADVPIWICDECRSTCGCHPGTERPLGSLADKWTRKARMRAHAAFDPLWRAKMASEGCSKKKARAAGYQWLAREFGIDPKDCHISLMTEGMAHRVAAICKAAVEPRRERAA